MDDSATARPGWVRVVAVPATLAELNGAVTGETGLPTRLFWSGPAPAAVRWDLSCRDRRRDLYEIVLVHGDLDDVRRLVDRAALLELWDELYLPPWVTEAWNPLIDAARASA